MSSALLRLSLAVILVSSPALAQNAGPTAEQLKAWIATREQRVNLHREEIKQTDARIESRLDVMINALTSIEDTKDSRTKVARMKEDTMKRLAKTIQYYDQKRASIREDLRNPRTQLTADEKRKIVAAFDARIEKRTKQIVGLKQSMPQSKDYERYEATGGGYWGTDYQRNKDFEQNRRMTSHSNTPRDALIKQLDASIARLDRLGRELRSQLAATTDPALRKEREADIARNDALIAERQQQRADVMKSSRQAQRGVALKEATDLDAAMKKATDELRRDFNSLFQRYNSLISEVGALHATEATLAAKNRGA
jgi:hypothetical protein